MRKFYRPRWRRKTRPSRPSHGSVSLLPFLLTIGNLSFGVLSILSVMQDHMFRAALFIVIGMILDGLDGWAARITRTSSAFGLEMDSLADMVTFGVAPSILLYRWALGSQVNPLLRPFAVAMTLFYVACTGIRLARFNLIPAGSDRRYFIGLPSPASAVMIASSVLWMPPISEGTPWGILPLTMEGVLAILMISEIRYRSSKALEIHRRWPLATFASFALLIALIASYPRQTLFIGSLCYSLSGILLYVISRLVHRRARSTEHYPLEPTTRL